MTTKKTIKLQRTFKVRQLKAELYQAEKRQAELAMTIRGMRLAIVALQSDPGRLTMVQLLELADQVTA